MDNPFIGMIALFGFNFPPKGWAYCNGQLIAIASNSALFALLGTMYGGDGRVTFALPDLRGRVPIGMGQGPGLSDYVQGEVSGTETTTLLISNMPAHNHQIIASGDAPTQNTASGALLASGNRSVSMPNIYEPNTNPVLMAQNMVSVTGSSQPFNNMQPYLALNYCISLYGIFPSRN